MQQKQKKKNRGIYVGIKSKLLLMSMVPVVFIIILGNLSYQKAAVAIGATSETATYNTLKKAGEYYELIIYTVEQSLDRISESEDLRWYYSGLYEEDVSEEFVVFQKINNSITIEHLANEYIDSINLIPVYGNYIFTKVASKEECYEEFSASEEALKIETSADEYTILGSHSTLDGILNQTNDEYGMSIGKAVKNTNLETISYILIDIKKDTLVESIGSMELPKGSYCSIVTSDGREITTDAFEGTDTFYDKEFFKTAVASGEKELKQTVSIDGENYLFIYIGIGDTGSSVCSLVPEAEIMKQATDIKKFTVEIVLLASGVAILLSFYVATGISISIRKIEKVTGKASEGDFTEQIKCRRKDEIGRLAKNTNRMLTDMRTLMGSSLKIADDVHKSSESVASNSRGLVENTKQISEAVGHIEIGITEQSSNAESCMKKMNELSNIIEIVSDNTESIKVVSNKTQLILSNGMDSMTSLSENVKQTTTVTNIAINNIKELHEESNKINSFTKIINNIADQTNLLALNASIEAARAGSAGRGFSIVAEEIRKLAEESMSASGNIQTVVMNIHNKINDTTVTIQKAGEIVKSQEKSLNNTVEAFTEIKNKMDGLSENIVIIAENVLQMTSAKEVTVDAIEHISVVLEETAIATTEVLTSVSDQVHAVEEFNEEVSSLQKESLELKESVSIFKI